MDVPHFYCASLAVGSNTLDETEARHAVGSLRLTDGAAVHLFDGTGRHARGTLHIALADGARRTRKKSPAVIVEITALDVEPPPTRTLTLIVAGCKGARLDWLVEKCTELGVTRLVLTEFARSVVHTEPKHADRLRATALAACKQSGRLRLPTIEAGVPLTAALDSVAAAALVIGAPGANSVPFGTWLAHGGMQQSAVASVIGPEGGLTDDEMTTLTARGGVPLRVGSHVLRVETAAIALAAVWAGHGPATNP